MQSQEWGLGPRAESCRGSRLAETGKVIDYAAIVRRMVDEHEVRVNRWRGDASGRAWRATAPDGSQLRLIEAPYPDSELTLAVFLHEIGHHAIGLDGWHFDCEAEYRAWEWAFKQMQTLGVHPGREVFARYDLSLRYAVYQERLRGVRELPACLTPFIPRAA